MTFANGGLRVIMVLSFLPNNVKQSNLVSLATPLSGILTGQLTGP
jgi:hypothetical protein